MKYPFDIVSYVRKKTFSVEARFTRKTDESPIRVFDDTFSRFIFTVIADGKAVTSNIPLDILDEVESISQFAHAKHLENKYAARETTSETAASPAFTVRFRTGNLKGKSPAEVIAENSPEEAKKILNNQYKWLKDNLAKYPANKEIMDAIMDATKLDPETIKANAGAGSATIPPITILDIGTRPLIRKKREDGKCFCYECKVMWDTSKNYPVSVTISNYYAPVIQKENGMLNVQLSGKDKATEKTHEFSMSAAEWLNAVTQMKATKDGFYRMHLADAFRLAERADRENREAAKQKKDENGAQEVA